MAIMPGAIWRPLPSASKTRMAAYDILCWHTMVGSLTGTDGYFRSGKTSANSHFGVGHDGTIYQWVDTAYRSAANGAGNHRCVTVETADVGTGFPKWNLNDGAAVPAWTAAQIEANAKIAAWVYETHGIPLTLIPDAKPGRRGNGYHRQGVPGFMVAGAEKWSSAPGKVCPGNRRIAQIPAVLARANQLVGVATSKIKEDDDMPSPSDLWSFVRKLGDPHPYDRIVGIDGKTGESNVRLERVEKKLDELLAKLKQ